MDTLRGGDIRGIPGSTVENGTVDFGRLFGFRKGVDPRTKEGMDQIQSIAQGYATGAYSQDQINNFIQSNPDTASFLTPVVQRTNLQRQISQQFLTGDKPDLVRAAEAAIAAGDPELATKYITLYRQSPKSIENALNTVQRLQEQPQGAASPGQDITTNISSTGDVSFVAKPGEIQWQNVGDKLIPTRHGVPISQGSSLAPIPLNLAGTAQAKETGSATGAATVKKQFEQPKDLTSLEDINAKADAAIDAAKAVLKHPGLSLATGRTAWMGNTVAGVPINQDAYDASQLLATLKGQIMLSVLQSFRNASANGSSGFGQLSNAEGDTLRNSVSNLNAAQSLPQLKKALQNVIDTLQGSKDRAYRGYVRLYNQRPDVKTYHTNPNVPESSGWKIEKVK